MNKKKSYLIVLMTILMCMFLSVPVWAAKKEGWHQNQKGVYYMRKSASGKKLVKAKGLEMIQGRSFYFDQKGYLQTGWVQVENRYCYFRTTGTPGVLGMMYKGFHTVNKRFFYFKKNGDVMTGIYKVRGNYYFFSRSKKPGVRGRAYCNTWISSKGKIYYADEKSILQFNQWVKDIYYVDENGVKVVNTWKTIEDKKYYFDENGAKAVGLKKIDNKGYYFDENGVMQTGLQVVGDHTYFFSEEGELETGWVTDGTNTYYADKNGHILKNTSKKGYVFDESGVATRTSKPKILIIGGHGQGDSGAVSNLGEEYLLTRQFAKLIYQELKKNTALETDFYKNGSRSYNCYEQVKTTLNAAGIQGKVTGSGTLKRKTAAALLKNKHLPIMTDYDYVLEVHFNMTGNSNVASSNGSLMGACIYVNSHKDKKNVDRAILSNFEKAGYKIFSERIYESSSLLNARVFQELGVSYGLLETAFLDDGDDMAFYKKNKTKLAKAVAEAIAAEVH